VLNSLEHIKKLKGKTTFTYNLYQKNTVMRDNVSCIKHIAQIALKSNKLRSPNLP